MSTRGIMGFRLDKTDHLPQCRPQSVVASMACEYRRIFNAAENQFVAEHEEYLDYQEVIVQYSNYFRPMLELPDLGFTFTFDAETPEKSYGGLAVFGLDGWDPIGYGMDRFTLGDRTRTYEAFLTFLHIFAIGLPEHRYLELIECAANARDNTDKIKEGL